MESVLLRPDKGGEPDLFVSSMKRRGLPLDHIARCQAADDEFRRETAVVLVSKSDRGKIQKEVKNKKKNGEDVDSKTLVKLKELNVSLKGADAKLEAKRKHLASLLSMCPNLIDDDWVPPPVPPPSSSPPYPPTPLLTSFLESLNLTPRSAITSFWHTQTFSSYLLHPSPSTPPPSTPPTPLDMLSCHSNRWVPEKDLPSMYLSSTPDSFTVLGLHTHIVKDGREMMTRVVEDLISLISTLSLPFSITVLPPPSLPPLSACSVTLSPSPTSPPYAVVSNFTDFHGRQHGVRGGVKKMIQIRKNFAQTIEAEVDVGRIWEGKGEVGWKDVPPIILLSSLNQHLQKFSYISPTSYSPSQSDSEILKEITAMGGITVEDYNSFKGLKRWAENVEGSNAR